MFASCPSHGARRAISGGDRVQHDEDTHARHQLRWAFAAVMRACLLCSRLRYVRRQAPSRRYQNPTTRCATCARRPRPDMPAAWRWSWCRRQRRRVRTPIRWGSRAALRPKRARPRKSRRPHPGEGGFGLRPQDLHSIYGLPTSATSAQTIALVDAYNDLSAEADLKLYSKEFALPELAACTAKSERLLREGQPDGAKPGTCPFPRAPKQGSRRSGLQKQSSDQKSPRSKGSGLQEVEEADGWGEEISLDIEVSHATCQSCKIMLVEARLGLVRRPRRSREDGCQASAPRRSRTPGAAPTPGRDGGSKTAQAAFKQPGIVDHRGGGRRRLPGLGRRTRSRKRLRRLPRLLPTRGCGGRHPPAGPARPRWNVGGRDRLEHGGTSEGAPMATAPAEAAVALRSPLRLAAEHLRLGIGRMRRTTRRRRCLRRRRSLYGDRDVRLHRGMRIRRRRRTTKWATGARSAAPASPRRSSPRSFALAGGARRSRIPGGDPVRKRDRRPELVARHHLRVQRVMRGSSSTKKKASLAVPRSKRRPSCSEEAICLAREGYDGPTGVGTPNGIAAFEPTDEEVKRESEKRREETLALKSETA